MAGLKAKKDDEGNKVTLDISNRTIVRVMVIIVATLLALAAIQVASYALTLIGIAFFLALALNAPVRWFERHLPGKKGAHRTAATAISFFIVIAALFGFLASIVPPLVRETGNFIERAPTLVDEVRDENSAIGSFVSRYNLQEHIDNAALQLSSQFDNIGSTAVSAFSTVAGGVVATLTVLVLTFMMLIEGPRWVDTLKKMLPEHRQKRVEFLVRDMYRVVRGYVNGQVVLAFTASLLILPPLLILDIPYPAALMVIVFIAGLIPLVGHTIGAIVVSLVALFQSPLDAVIILAYYILYQQIENTIIQPRVQANTTNMSPLLVFGAVIVGVNFGGLLAGLVAIPVAGCIRILLIDYLREKKVLKAGDVDTGSATADTK